MVRRFAGTAVVLGLVGLVATAVLLWWLPANDFLFVPDRAKPLADKVVVQGAQNPAGGDVYYVDLFVRRIRKLEKLLPFTRPDGATFVPAERLTPDGTTEADRDRQNAEGDQIRPSEHRNIEVAIEDQIIDCQQAQVEHWKQRHNQHRQCVPHLQTDPMAIEDQQKDQQG